MTKARKINPDICRMDGQDIKMITRKGSGICSIQCEKEEQRRATSEPDMKMEHVA